MFEILKQTVKICEGQGVEGFQSSAAELQLSLFPSLVLQAAVQGGGH